MAYLSYWRETGEITKTGNMTGLEPNRKAKILTIKEIKILQRSSKFGKGGSYGNVIEREKSYRYW